MTSEKINRIAIEWFEAFNHHDLERLLSLYDEEAEHYSPKLKVRLPETNGLIKGKNALRQWWKDSFDRLPSLHYKVIQLTPHDDRVFMEYIRQVDSEEDLQVGETLVIINGLIVASRVYHS
jgi:ketosteroid isomerase-like protein